VFKFVGAALVDPIIKNGGTTSPVGGTKSTVTPTIEVIGILFAVAIIALIIWRVNVSAAQKKKGP
jgi:hypothetical protein